MGTTTVTLRRSLLLPQQPYLFLVADLCDGFVNLVDRAQSSYIRIHSPGITGIRRLGEPPRWCYQYIWDRNERFCGVCIAPLFILTLICDFISGHHKPFAG